MSEQGNEGAQTFDLTADDVTSAEAPLLDPSAFALGSSHAPASPKPAPTAPKDAPAKPAAKQPPHKRNPSAIVSAAMNVRLFDALVATAKPRPQPAAPAAPVLDAPVAPNEEPAAIAPPEVVPVPAARILEAFMPAAPIDKPNASSAPATPASVEQSAIATSDVAIETRTQTPLATVVSVAPVRILGAFLRPAAVGATPASSVIADTTSVDHASTASDIGESATASLAIPTSSRLEPVPDAPVTDAHLSSNDVGATHASSAPPAARSAAEEVTLVSPALLNQPSLNDTPVARTAPVLVPIVALNTVAEAPLADSTVPQFPALSAPENLLVEDVVDLDVGPRSAAPKLTELAAADIVHVDEVEPTVAAVAKSFVDDVAPVDQTAPVTLNFSSLSMAGEVSGNEPAVISSFGGVSATEPLAAAAVAGNSQPIFTPVIAEAIVEAPPVIETVVPNADPLPAEPSDEVADPIAMIDVAAEEAAEAAANEAREALPRWHAAFRKKSAKKPAVVVTEDLDEEEGEDEEESIEEVVASSHAAAAPTSSSGAWWTLPLLCVGVSILACAVLVPAADENRQAAHELAKIEQEVAYFQTQSETNKQFLEHVANDPVLAERLAMRQLRLGRPESRTVDLPSGHDRFAMSPFALVHVDRPAPLPEYKPVAGVLGRWFNDARRQLYLAGAGLLLVAAGVILGGKDEAEAAV